MPKNEIFDYFYSSIDIIIDKKVKDIIELKSKEFQDFFNYEEMLKKLESDIRSHIKASY